MNYIERLKEILSILNTPVELYEPYKFENGDYYIQQSESAFKQVKAEILKLAATHFNNDWYLQDHHIHGIVGRYFDDSDRHFYRAWYTLGCIDQINYRQWGQMYFAQNPNPAATPLQHNNKIRQHKLDNLLS